MSNQQYTDKDSFLASARIAIDVTPSANDLPLYTRCVMVSTDGATITGVLEGDTVSSTTFPLMTGLMYPFAFKKITAVSTGTVKGYC